MGGNPLFTTNLNEIEVSKSLYAIKEMIKINL